MKHFKKLLITLTAAVSTTALPLVAASCNNEKLALENGKKNTQITCNYWKMLNPNCKIWMSNQSIWKNWWKYWKSIKLTSKCHL